MVKGYNVMKYNIKRERDVGRPRIGWYRTWFKYVTF
jgi:hypothetical protein